jgi:hypothetical protein
MQHWSDPAVIASLAGVAIALLYTIITVLIWHATWQNTKATRAVIEATQRPYLGITNIRPIYPEVSGGNVPIAISIGNIGTIPSRNLAVTLNVAFPDGKQLEDHIGSEVGCAISLFQGHTYTASFELSGDRIQFLWNGGFTVAVTVRYQGMTDKQYTTCGEYKYRDQSEGFSVVSGHFE